MVSLLIVWSTKEDGAARSSIEEARERQSPFVMYLQERIHPGNGFARLVS